MIRIRRAIIILLLWAASASNATDFKGAYFVGHLRPDSDSILGAIGAAYLFEGIPVRVGEINNETRFVLEKYHLDPPALVTEFYEKKFFLLDHNQTVQADSRIKSAQIVGIIDHHALQESPFVFDSPILIDIRPWGSTCTIIADRFFADNKALPPSIAAALLCGILSDTVILTSPTTTRVDSVMAVRLAQIANVDDMVALGRAMFEAKSALAGYSAKEIVLLDYKTYKMSDLDVGFGVAETINPSELLQRKIELLLAMQEAKNEQKLDLLYFAIVDVLEKRSYLLLLPGEEQRIGEAAFGRPDKSHLVALPNVVSRKRQLIPKLQQALEK
jgi:manganese-dependent inorganic pyrophosphatase